jgi:hypothetical protein
VADSGLEASGCPMVGRASERLTGRPARARAERVSRSNLRDGARRGHSVVSGRPAPRATGFRRPASNAHRTRVLLGGGVLIALLAGPRQQRSRPRSDRQLELHRHRPVRAKGRDPRIGRIMAADVVGVVLIAPAGLLLG